LGDLQLQSMANDMIVSSEVDLVSVFKER
jgi:hypothetical protein